MKLPNKTENSIVAYLQHKGVETSLVQGIVNACADAAEEYLAWEIPPQAEKNKKIRRQAKRIDSFIESIESLQIHAYETKKDLRRAQARLLEQANHRISSPKRVFFVKELAVALKGLGFRVSSARGNILGELADLTLSGIEPVSADLHREVCIAVRMVNRGAKTGP